MSNFFTGDDEPEPPGLEDEPGGNFLNYGVLEILTPGGEVALTIDLEILSDHCMSEGEFARAAAFQVATRIAPLIASPRFRQRFGTDPTTHVFFTGCTRE